MIKATRKGVSFEANTCRDSGSLASVTLLIHCGLVTVYAFIVLPYGSATAMERLATMRQPNNMKYRVFFDGKMQSH